MSLIISFLILLFSIAPMRGNEASFGYIVHSTVNIGDDIQSLAVRRLLPPDAVGIDREQVHEFSCPAKVFTVISGWFMHHRNGYWDLPTPPPIQSWPPSSKIHPFFISVHFTDTLFPALFTEENIEYLKEYGPIGARDLFTLEELQKRGIPSYFSGCLTLTLDNPLKKRNNLIYLVDVDDETANYVRSKTTLPVVRLTHGQPVLQLLKPEYRLKYAEHFLDKYRQCKCVVTTRLHAALPCLAFETPVLLISPTRQGTVDPRFPGLWELTRHCYKEELLAGAVDFDFDHPTENPKGYIAIRERLIQTMADWVRHMNLSK